MTTRRAYLPVAAFLAAALLSGCMKDPAGAPGASGEAITFGSYRRSLHTRADANVRSFPEGTAYTLLSVRSQGNPADYDWDTGKSFDQQPTVGEETSRHTISYSPVAVFPSGAELDFYALTYGTNTAPGLAAAVADGVDPTINLQRDANDRLPDLMHSMDAKRRKSSDGTVILPFDHALAAVNFLVSKQDESGDGVEMRQLEHVRIVGLELDNAAFAGSMDVVDGSWSWTRTSVGTRVVYSGDGDGTMLDVNPTDLGVTDYLVIPNDDGDDENNVWDPAEPYRYRKPADDESAEGGEQVIVSVILEGLETFDPLAGVYVPLDKTLVDGTEVVGGRARVSVPVRVFDDAYGQDHGPLHFERNMRYTISVLVMRDNVRIVAVSPQVYDWQNVNLTESVEKLGQPVVFGDVVWMDRNLGASSADCENDWLHTLGYWYEYARNVPFMMDMDVYESKGYYINTSYTLVNSNGQAVKGTPGANPAWPDYFVYTYDDKGRKVSGFQNTTCSILADLPENAGKTDREIVAIDPGDPGIYDYLWYSSSASYWYYVGAHNFTNTYWYDVSQQPVPKGWRLPNAKDVYSIMPEETLSWTSSTARFNVVGVPTPKTTSGTAKTFAGTYKYQFFYGNIQVDPDADPDADYSAPLRGDVAKTRLYGIKYQGTTKAYRYMIEMRNSNITRGNYVRFSQFPANADDVFLSVGTGDARTWNLHKFDWSHPSAYLDFPLQGQLGNGTITLFGKEIKIRLKERNGTGTYCMKLSNDGTGVYNTYQSTTCPTRLVRDFDAK